MESSHISTDKAHTYLSNDIFFIEIYTLYENDYLHLQLVAGFIVYYCIGALLKRSVENLTHLFSYNIMHFVAVDEVLR